MLSFGTNNSNIIYSIVIDAKNKSQWVQISNKYNLSIYFIKKICKHFNKLVQSDNEDEVLQSIQCELKNIYINNNKKKVYKYDRKGYYKRDPEYYKNYMKQRRFKEKLLKAQKLISDNSNILLDMEIKSICSAT